jgi:beta-xylosidase
MAMPHEAVLEAAEVGNYPWIPDCGDGSYRNPIILADYSDPDILRHGEDFYLIASSFNCTPGLPILHSRDLINWTLINHAVKNLPDPRYAEVQTGCGVWAPAIRYHDGKFWIFFPMPDEGIYVTTAADPAGEWSEPWCLAAAKGLIDPCPLWDEDGKAYLVLAYARSRCGIKHRLSIYGMAPDASRLLDEGRVIYDNEDVHPTLEGPKFLKKDGWYYVLAPAGGVKTGWQVVFRSRNIYGPYEDKIVLAQGRTEINGPHQGGLVDLPNGDWWFVHFQDAYVYGRIVHLQPVRWEDGWPLMGVNQDADGCGEPVLRHPKPALPESPCAIPQTSDEFDSPKLGLQWQWEANHEDDWHSLEQRPGYLRLFARPMKLAALREAPHILGQKFPARAFRVETQLELVGVAEQQLAGLTVMGQSHAAISLRRGDDGYEIVFTVNGEESFVTSASNSTVRLAVEVADGALCRFGYAEPGEDFEFVSPSFQAQEGHWIGARVGIFSGYEGTVPSEPAYADFDYFRFSSI